MEYTTLPITAPYDIKDRDNPSTMQDEDKIDYGNCSQDIPSSREFLTDPSTTGITILCTLWVCAIIVIAIFIEEIIFFGKHYAKSSKKFGGKHSIYVLALAPVFTISALLGVMVPRAGVLVDLVADAYFPTAMFSLHALIRHYLGGRRSMETCGVEELRLNTPPCCCCMPCLPAITFNRRSYQFLTGLVFQTTVVRPVLMFITAVLWVDGSYIPGKVSADNAFIYLVVLNNVTSLVAIWGLLIIQKNYAPFLQRHSVTRKFLFLQFILLGTALGNMIIGILVSNNVIPCNRLLPSGSRAQIIYHTYVVYLMVLVSVWGRFAFRRTEDVSPKSLHLDVSTESQLAAGTSDVERGSPDDVSTQDIEETLTPINA